MFFLRLTGVVSLIVLLLAGDVRELVGVKHVEPEAIPMTYEVTLGALLQMMRAPDVYIIDGRSSSAFAAGHLAGAVNVPFPATGSDRPALPAPRGARTVVVYGEGAGARQARALAQELGARDQRYVAVYAAGYAEWSAAGLPVQ